MNRQSPTGGDSTWKGIAIIAGAIVVGLVVFSSIPEAGTQVAAGTTRDQPRGTTTTLKDPPPPSVTTSTSVPLKEAKDIKVLVANGTTTTGATQKIVSALRPACYAVQNPVDALAKIKSENRPTTTVYSTPGYEREAALIAKQLQLPDSANAALPADQPIPTRGQPSFNVLILLAKDLVDKPPSALPGAECATTSTTVAGSARTTTTRRATASTAKANTTTTKAITTTTKAVTTTAP